MRGQQPLGLLNGICSCDHQLHRQYAVPERTGAERKTAKDKPNMKKKTVIDLFSGAGGLSLGAARAGFQLAGAVELDKNAIATHQNNFPKVKHLAADVSKFTGATLLQQFDIPEGSLGGLIGGPPCQGFSSIGRKDPSDSRNELFGDFMRLAGEALPEFFVAENVPGIMLAKNRQIVDEALKHVEQHYVIFKPFEAKANLLGAPTVRTRLFFIGIRKDKAQGISHDYFERMPPFEDVKVADALKGLPAEISPEWKGKSAWAQAEKLPNSYFNDRAQGFIPEGVGNPEALAKFNESNLTSGCVGTIHAPVLVERYGSLAAGARDPISRSTRLDDSGYCPTLRAGTGPDKGSYQAVRPIHPTQPRVITPREAARLQGFPDWFLLPDTKWHAFRQIGNSVSPLVAEAVLTKIAKALGLSEPNS